MSKVGVVLRKRSARVLDESSSSSGGGSSSMARSTSLACRSAMIARIESASRQMRNECKPDFLRPPMSKPPGLNRMNRNRHASIRMNSNKTMSSIARLAIVEARLVNLLISTCANTCLIVSGVASKTSHLFKPYRRHAGCRSGCSRP